MSESAGTLSDAFAGAVERVVRLHQTQVYELQSELQRQHQLCEQQHRKIVEKEERLQRMKEIISQAKCKIKEQRNVIQDLIKRIPGTPPSSLLKYINSESADQSGDEPSTPYPRPKAPVDPNHVNSALKVSTANKTINRTDISLFSSLSKTLTPVAILQPNTATPECQQEEVNNDTTNMVTADASNTFEVHSESTSSSGSSFTSNNSDVIIVGEGDVTLFYPGRTPSQAPTHTAPPAIPQVQFNSSLASTPSDIDACVYSITGSEEEEEEEEEREEESECAVPCFSKNLLQSSSAYKGLSLRDGPGRVRYKELNTASAHSSIVASSSRTTVCSTATGCSDGIASVKSSALSSSPETDNSLGSQSSSAASPSSPSMLCSSGSPWKRPRSPPVSVVPSTQLGSRIPKSDSQLSLDMCQTMPLSPELHPSTTKEKKVCFKSDTETEKLNQQNHTNLSSLSHKDQFCATTKPPIPTSSHQTRPKRRKKKPKQLKQVTLTQTMTPLPKEQHKHCVKQLNSIITNSKGTLPPTVMLATPGMKPVSNITGTWFDKHQLQVKEGSKLTSLPTKRTHMHQNDEHPCEDAEDVLPKKKAHLDSVPQKTLSDNFTKVTPNTEAVIDDDVTRIDEELPSEGSEDEPSPVFDPPKILPKHYQCVTESNNLSLNETSNECEDSVDAKVNTADEITKEEKEVNLAADWKTHAKTLAAKAGLPTAYKCVTVIKKRSDRDKLDAKPCPECQAWFTGQDGIHRDQRQHLMHTCRHKDLYLPPDSDSAQWEISFPSTEVCERLMN